ncbi:hypothetical protein DMC30DRAFT_420238 [Rhodotorula diobovata]|uniref:RNase III domain-containing protein n=1 Tax=Rhodotorula diobovata TaxID=5288 RepID=A0A5C5FL06_9BASI|nr:hypothetical protein DMC30DRAFT_420238 [Rhodotorula diobovata]
MALSASTLYWSPPGLDIVSDGLPLLSAISSPALDRLTGSTKDFLRVVASHGRLSSYAYPDEVETQGRLEWLGDSALRDHLTKRLFRHFRDVGSGVLSRVCATIPSSDTHSYGVWAYRLDKRVPKPAEPQKHRHTWRRLAQVQSIIADMFDLVE